LYDLKHQNFVHVLDSKFYHDFEMFDDFLLDQDDLLQLPQSLLQLPQSLLQLPRSLLQLPQSLLQQSQYSSHQGYCCLLFHQSFHQRSYRQDHLYYDGF
jgi:hypothetical protein